jgi:hypothetical protein
MLLFGISDCYLLLDVGFSRRVLDSSLFLDVVISLMSVVDFSSLRFSSFLLTFRAAGIVLCACVKLFLCSCFLIYDGFILGCFGAP